LHKFLAEHIKFLLRSLKRRKSGQIFPKISSRTHHKLLGARRRAIFFSRTHHFFSRSEALWEAYAFRGLLAYRVHPTDNIW